MGAHACAWVILAAAGTWFLLGAPGSYWVPLIAPRLPDTAQTEVDIWRRMDRAEGREAGTTKEDEKLTEDCKESMKKPKRLSQRPWSPDFQKETQACMAEGLEAQDESC